MKKLFTIKTMFEGEGEGESVTKCHTQTTHTLTIAHSTNQLNNLTLTCCFVRDGVVSDVDSRQSGLGEWFLFFLNFQSKTNTRE
jgi:hypothetical protein